mgnify:CR=1 FL=1
MLKQVSRRFCKRCLLLTYMCFVSSICCTLSICTTQCTFLYHTHTRSHSPSLNHTSFPDCPLFSTYNSLYHIGRMADTSGSGSAAVAKRKPRNKGIVKDVKKVFKFIYGYSIPTFRYLLLPSLLFVSINFTEPAPTLS